MTVIYRGRRLVVESVPVRTSSGMKERVVVRPGDAVAILPVEAGRCCLIRQFRFAIGETIWEAPAGTIEPGETPEETAHRELVEETGRSAGRLIPRGVIWTTPGYTDERIYLFEARELRQSDEFEPDEDEVIEVVPVSVKTALAMAREGRIQDAKTLCLIFRCLG
ncbi:MAG: NUDIX hydrolase [Methanoculleaceae archaeon]